MSKEGEKIILRSSDEDEFKMEKRAAMVSVTLKNMVDIGCVEGVIPLQTINSKILAKVIEYCNKHASVSDKTLHGWDRDFIRAADVDALFDLMYAADFLDMKTLMDITAQAIADHIKDMSPEEIRSLFMIENYFCPEEEKTTRLEILPLSPSSFINDFQIRISETLNSCLVHSSAFMF